jgi:hypothetical protein
MLEKIINKLPFKNTIIASALLFGLNACGDSTTINNYFFQSDVKKDSQQLEVVDQSPPVDLYQEDVEEEPCSDFDADGICNDVDLCPLETEDFDGFEDEDGCPEYNLEVKDSYDLKEDTFEIKEDIGNQCPYFDPEVEDIEVNEKDSLEIDFNAVDPDGDNISYQLFGFNEDDQEWVGISEIDEFNPETGNIGPIQLGCYDADDLQLKIVASDGKCEVEKEFMLTINEICDCLYDGEIQKVDCETDSPCVGTQTKECVNGYWETISECEDIKLIGHGVLPSVSGNKVAFLNDNNSPYTIDIHNIAEGTTKSVYSFQLGEEPLMSLKLDGNQLMFTTKNADGYNNNISILDINNNKKLIDFSFPGVVCTDIDGDKALCFDNGSLLMIDIPKEQDLFFSYEPCFDSNNDLYNLLMDDGFIVVSDWDCDNTISIYNTSNDKFLGFNVEGEAPLISNGKMVYLDKVVNIPGENNSLLSIENINSDAEEYLAEDITQKMGGFSCLNTYGYFADLENDTLVCHVDDGSDQLYVANLKEKTYQKISEKVPSAGGYVSLSGNKLVFTFDEDIGDNVPMYLCELKSQWVEYPEEAVEEEVEIE